jgi:hypothetical protein
VAESTLSVTSEAYHASGHSHVGTMSFAVHGPISLFPTKELQGRIRLVAPGVSIGERPDPFLLQKLQLLPPAPHDLVQVFHHAVAVPPNSFRYASMNGSSFPSMTPWTSPTLSSVR